MATIPRKYTGKDVEMLLSISTIIDSAIAHKDLLQTKRSTWGDPFFDNLKTDIDQVIKDHLGVDSAKDLRNATQVVIAIQKSALTLLAEFKVQLEEDFKQDKQRRDELLKELGFTTYLKDVQKGDQEAMISLLYQFKQNMDSSLQTEITSKGTHPETIKAITSFAQQLKDQDISQEGFKGNKKQVTALAVQTFNDIYDRVMSVARISAKFFKDDSAKAGLFSYAQVKAALNSSSTQSSKKPSTPPKA